MGTALPKPHGSIPARSCRYQMQPVLCRVRHSQQGQNPGSSPPAVHRGCLRYPRCTWGSWACAIRAVHMGSLVLLSGCQPEAPLRTARLGGLQHLGFSPGRIQKQRHVGENAWSFSFCQTALSCAGRRLIGTARWVPPGRAATWARH